MTHQGLSGAGIQLDEIVEGEHQRLDALGGFAVFLFQRGDEAGLGLAVEIIEDFGHHLVGVAASGLRQVRHELDAQRLLDPLDHLLLHSLHLQHASDDVERHVLGQDREHARGMLRLQLREHDRDGLRIFVLQIIGEHLFLDVGELLPHVAAGGAADLVHDAGHAVRRQILLQQPLGGVEIAHQRAGGRHARDEFEQHVLHRGGFDSAERGHLKRQLAHLVVVEQRPDLAAILFAERQHQHRGALRARDVRFRPAGLAGRKARKHLGNIVRICGLRCHLSSQRQITRSDQVAAVSLSHWRTMATVSLGLRSASSPTRCTDWAWTWPWTCATSSHCAAVAPGTSAWPEAAGFALASSSAGVAPLVKAAISSEARIFLTIGRTTMNITTRPSSIMTPSSMMYMTSSFVNCTMPSRPDGSEICGTAGASANFRFTTSTWSPRFWSKPIAERTSAAMRSSSSLPRSL